MASVVIPGAAAARKRAAEPVPETRRRQIETVASQLFRERGYAGTGMREIARVLQLQGASLYAHIGSKEDVLLAIVDRAADQFAQAINPHVSSEAPARDRLRSMIRAHVRVLTDDLAAAAVYLQEWRFLGDERRQVILAERDAYERAFRRVIGEGIETNDFRPIDPKLAARSLLASLNGIADWWHPDGPLTAGTIGEAYADLHLAGLLAELTLPPTTTTLRRRTNR